MAIVIVHEMIPTLNKLMHSRWELMIRSSLDNS